MNLILLHPEDFIDSSRTRLTGRRTAHVRQIHRAKEGDEFTVGVLGGQIGTGRVLRLDDDSLEMEVQLDRDPPAPLPLTLVLALPRPKVMRRILFSVSVLGVKRIVLVNSARVEKSYWQTPFLEPDAIRRQLILGLEQARDTTLPEVLLRPRFKPFAEDELSALSVNSLSLVAHPYSADSCPRGVAGSVTLAIGPEGGFIPYEVDTLISLGFQSINIGDRILNVESAVPALISRLF